MNEQAKLDIDTTVPVSTCEHCHEPFTPRAAGKAQRFCSPEYRVVFNNSQRSNKSNVSSASDTFEEPEEPEPPKPAFKPAPVQDDTEKFSWNDDDCVVVPHQAAIAVYFNPHGDVVIRQEGHYGPDEDHWVVVLKEKLVALILRLQEMSGEF